jgi:hypothetical protein
MNTFCVGQNDQAVEECGGATTRRRGIGRALVEAAERRARSWGCHQMASDVEMRNTVSDQAHGELRYEETTRVVLFKKGLKWMSLVANLPNQTPRPGVLAPAPAPMISQKERPIVMEPTAKPYVHLSIHAVDAVAFDPEGRHDADRQ